MGRGQRLRSALARRLLAAPGAGWLLRRAFVARYARRALARAPADRRDERRAQVRALYRVGVEVYETALEEGLAERDARFAVEAVANFQYLRQGWVDMLTVPPEAVPDQRERLEQFFREHVVTLEDPLGEFVPIGGLPDAPATTDRLPEASRPTDDSGSEIDFPDDAEIEARRTGEPDLERYFGEG